MLAYRYKARVRSMNAKALVSSKGQVVIPKHLRKALGIHAGSELAITLKAGNILELQFVQRSIKEFFGQGSVYINNEQIIDVNEAIAKAVTDNDQR